MCVEATGIRQGWIREVHHLTRRPFLKKFSKKLQNSSLFGKCVIWICFLQGSDLRFELLELLQRRGEDYYGGEEKDGEINDLIDFLCTA